jgi:Ran-binding protein 3
MKSKNSIAPATGFGALAGSAKSTFGGSTFGSSLGGGFGALASSKPATSAASTNPTINGLESETYAFGSREDRTAKTADAEDGDDDDAENDSTEKERQSSQPLLSQQRTSYAASSLTCANSITAHETGEEGETTAWTGRAKLYTMSGEGSSKAWKERGVGTFKLNVTVDEPKKARFVLRADGTHRLLLNAAVTKQLVFGGDSNGEKPKDGRVLFNSPTADGELEMHLLKVRGDLFREKHFLENMC